MGCLEMRRKMRSGVVSALAALGLCVAVAGAPADAAALGITLPIAIELGPQRTGPFGILQIEEIAGGDLEFTIRLGSVLGSRANLHEFYFNLPSCFDSDGLEISGSRCDGGSCDVAFELDEGGSTRGGAGARFGFSVNFGNGSGSNGNDNLQVAKFVLGADAAIALADVLAEASSTGRGLEVLFAAHVTGGGPGAGRGSASATIGVSPSAVPEPATAVLLGFGLAGLAFGGRRPRV